MDRTTIPIELKRINSFLVEFPEIFSIPINSIEKINQPKFNNGKWENIRIDFINMVRLSTSKGLFNIVNFLNTNKSADKNLFEVKIKLLDKTHQEVEEWIIYVEKVLLINFGELDYNCNDIQKSFIILKPSNCVLS